MEHLQIALRQAIDPHEESSLELHALNVLDVEHPHGGFVTDRYAIRTRHHADVIFAGGSGGDYTSGHLIWIIHNANEPAYR